jgi:hypothetical protein
MSDRLCLDRQITLELLYFELPEDAILHIFTRYF